MFGGLVVAVDQNEAKAGGCRPSGVSTIRRQEVDISLAIYRPSTASRSTRKSDWKMLTSWTVRTALSRGSTPILRWTRTAVRSSFSVAVIRACAFSSEASTGPGMLAHAIALARAIALRVGWGRRANKRLSRVSYGLPSVGIPHAHGQYRNDMCARFPWFAPCSGRIEPVSSAQISAGLASSGQEGRYVQGIADRIDYPVS